MLEWKFRIPVLAKIRYFCWKSVKTKKKNINFPRVRTKPTRRRQEKAHSSNNVSHRVSTHSKWQDGIRLLDLFKTETVMVVGALVDDTHTCSIQFAPISLDCSGYKIETLDNWQCRWKEEGEWEMPQWCFRVRKWDVWNQGGDFSKVTQQWYFLGLWIFTFSCTAWNSWNYTISANFLEIQALL